MKSKSKSVKDQVFSYINVHPNATFSELRNALPDINPSSVSAYHSIWKKSPEGQKVMGTAGKKKKAVKGKTKKSVAAKTVGKIKAAKKASAVSERPQTATSKELIEALKATVDAQKGTIEVMKTQNAMLKETQSGIFAELGDVSKKELEELKKIMAIYVRGLKS
ncbi:MAG: hypothetical protein GY866_22405 [Proteobacteria bacterium]|nr:hypothetical protein [Pseudomonadota bacterium]